MQCVRCEALTVVPLEEAAETGHLECPHCFGRLRLKVVHTDRRRVDAPVQVDRRD